MRSRNGRPSRRLLRVFCVAIVFVSISAFSQTNVNEEQGLKPYDSLHGGDLDSVSLTSGGLNLQIPLASFPQRGSVPLDFLVAYSSKQWQVKKTCSANGKTCGPFFWAPAVRGNSGAQVVSSLDWWKQYSVSADTPTQYSMSVTSPDGNLHQLGTSWNVVSYPMRSLDATGLLALDSNTLVLPNGTRYYYVNGRGNNAWGGFQASSVTDANGNQIIISSSGWTDTMGRVIPGTAALTTSHPQVQPGVATSDLSSCPSGTSSALLWSVPGVAGVNNGVRTFKFCYSIVPLSTNFQQSGVVEFSSTSTPFLTAIVLPDLSIWTFAYDSYGDLTQLTFPTGGSISYTYVKGPVTCTSGLAQFSMWVASRTVNANDGTGGHTWNYNYSGQVTSIPNGSGGYTYSYSGNATVTSPDNNDTVHAITSPISGADCSLFDTQTQYYQGPASSGTLLKTVQTQYTGIQNYYGSDGNIAANVVPVQVTTILPGNLSSKVVNTWDSGNFFRETDGSGLALNIPVVFNSLLQEDEYGYSGSLVRSTLNHYLWQDNATYKSNNFLSLLSLSTVCTQSSNCVDGTQTNRAAQTTYAYDEGNASSSGITTQLTAPPAGGNIRGNLTTVGHWLNTNNSFISSRTNWYDTGEVYQAIDPLGHTATHSYDPAYAGAYSTKTCDALSHCVSGAYDFNTGLLSSFTDANNQTSNYAYDLMLRLASAVLPADGSGNHPQTTFNYPNPTTVERLRKITTSLTDDAFTYVDGLGRMIQGKHLTPQGNIFINTTYDVRGRVATVTNPYLTTSDATYGTTQTQYDALGRVIQITRQDGSIARVDYTQPNCPVSTDEAGKARKSCSDALGRLITVWEDPTGLNYETDYQYDVLGNLLRVDQKGSAPSDSTQWRTRLFIYDSLSRLLTANNPESGLISYQYDNDSQMTAKIDARGITASYSYDALHRLTRESFSDGSYRGAYSYDETTSAFGNPVSNGIGRLTSSWQPYGGQGFSYDALGRTVQVRRAIDSTARSTKDFFYAYNLDGSLAQLTYPSGRVVTYAVDAAGRTTAATDSNGTSYVTNATYWPSGAQFQWHMPSVYLSRGLNNRLQTSYFYSDNGVISNYYLYKTYDYNSGHNNGNVVAITNNNDTTRSQSFSYDGLNRLLSAQNAGTDCSKTLPDGHTEYWGNSYGYDAWGNLLQKTVTKCSAENLNAAALGNNRLTGYSYDAAGNMLSDGSNAYSYDAGGMVKTAGSITYLYDADGERFQKWQNGTGWKSYWRGTGSAVLAEGDAAGNLTSEYIFFNGQRLARIDLPGNAVHYYLSDHLGSTSLEVSASGVIENESDYYPWGGELQFTNHDLGNHYKFTGKERDAESGLDYFGARYYSNGLGRFITPDWAAKAAAVPYADFADPQSLNLYTYVRNIPTTKYDADGHDGLMDTVAWVTAHIVVPVLVWMDKNHPPVIPTVIPSAPMGGIPGCHCPGPGGPQNNNNANKNQNNSQSSNTSGKADQLKANAVKGKAYEQNVKPQIEETQTGVQEQLTVKTESGTKTRVDFAGTTKSGETALTETKSSADAPLTPNQTKAFPEIEQTGATVVGQGKPGFPGGTKIPPTKVNVIRPPSDKH
jgi:RHS repeat-associated protein